MRLQNNFLFIYTILFTFISGLAFFASSCQQSDHDAVAAQNEEQATDYIEASYSGDFNILESSLTVTGTEMLPESVVLEACYEQLGIFLVPASEAEAYLPGGFEPVQADWFEIEYPPLWSEPENVDPSGEYALLSVWSIECNPVHEKEEPLNMVWMTIDVVPPEAYMTDDAALYSVPVRLFTSSPTLVETLHAYGIPQAELSDVTHIVNEKADTVRTGLAHATGGGEEVIMESNVAGSPIHRAAEDTGARRNFGVKDGQVSGVVEYRVSNYDIMPGDASLTENSLFSGQTPGSMFSVHAWEIEFHLEPVENR